MAPDTHAHYPLEIELKLALPAGDPSRLEAQLASVRALAHHKARHQHLHNVYYDTPQQTLHEKRVALRVRRIGAPTRPQWLQTLKMNGSNDSALSQRGEWEAALPQHTLNFDLLSATPWSELDPDGRLFQKLEPCFETIFDRTSWMVRQNHGSVIEVALDIGRIVVGSLSAPICELELELKAGEPGALFQLAQQIASTVSILPINRSKAERGYALAQNTLYAPVQALPVTPELNRSLPIMAQQLLREMYCQFTANLHSLHRSDDPEIAHQARVGWRRFKSGVRLFKQVLPLIPSVSLPTLQPLLAHLGTLRNIDVARVDTLPPLAHAYTDGNPQRQDRWQALEQALTSAADRQRQIVRGALDNPTIGSTLLAITQWLEEPPTAVDHDPREAPAHHMHAKWARSRIAHLHARFKLAHKDSNDPARQHRTRILAKRLRYNIEALRPLLPKRYTHHWYQQAKNLQTDIGAQRDRQQLLEIASHLDIDPGICDFLRGVVAATP